MSVILNADGTRTVVALEDGNLITGMVQDCNAIAEHAKARSNEGFHGSKDMRLAASIPLVMVEKYLHDNHLTMAEFSQSPVHLKRMVQDPALAHFRVWQGAL